MTNSMMCSCRWRKRRSRDGQARCRLTTPLLLMTTTTTSWLQRVSGVEQPVLSQTWTLLRRWAATPSTTRLPRTSSTYLRARGRYRRPASTGSVMLTVRRPRLAWALKPVRRFLRLPHHSFSAPMGSTSGTALAGSQLHRPRNHPPPLRIALQDALLRPVGARGTPSASGYLVSHCHDLDRPAAS